MCINELRSDKVGQPDCIKLVCQHEIISPVAGHDILPGRAVLAGYLIRSLRGATTTPVLAG